MSWIAANWIAVLIIFLGIILLLFVLGAFVFFNIFTGRIKEYEEREKKEGSVVVLAKK